MASIRSNSNGVCSVPERLSALKKRLTTCLKDWRKKASSTADEKHHRQQLFFTEQNFHERTSKNLKLFNTRLKRLFSAKKAAHFDTIRIQRGAGEKWIEDQKVEIVAKLLSSALLAKSTITETTAYVEYFADAKEQEEEEEPLEKEENLDTDSGIYSSNSTIDKMTITNNTLLEIRDEFPDLEAEVRSILVARAQEGATICDIKDDYKKMTGLHFPVYNNITDFLLSIPSVTAFCSEQGTRIFNIIPTEKTQHVYDMVMMQKPQVLRPSYTQNARSNAIYYSNNQLRSYNQNDRAINTIAKFPPADKVSVSADSAAGSNCCYEDNYNYLNNRFYNIGQTSKKYNSNHYNDENHNDNYRNLNTNNLLPYNNLCSFAQHTVQQNKPASISSSDPANNLIKPTIVNPFRRPSTVRPPLTSSPTATRSSEVDSVYTTDSEYEAHLLDFPLLGDDLFLYLARMELRCKFKKNQRVLQSGLCVSGQTISAAIRRIRKLAERITGNRRIIVNIGSVDIMQGKPLVQIEHEFRELIDVIVRHSLTPILTTLAPLANYAHVEQIKDKLERFNEFIKREGGSTLLVIDIWSCLVNEKRQIMFDCYQNEPRNVTGTTEPYVFWNKIGRQRVLQMIASNLEY